MNDINKLSKQIPAMESSFIIDVKGEVTQISYQGEFMCRIPNLKINAQIDKYRALLNGGLENSLNLGVLKLHKMISYLKYCIIKSPEFWVKSDCGYELLDYNVIEEVYNKVLAFENEWIESIWGKKEPEAIADEK